jgi:hypothetical protein
MPFSAPTTYASKANAGYQSQLLIGSSASPPVYTPVLEVKTIQPDQASMPEIDTTHLLSVANTEEFVPGMIKPGKVTIGGNFIGDSTQLNFTTLLQAQTIFPFQVTAPVQRGAKTYTLAGNAFIASYKNGPFENNKAIEFQVELQITGVYTETVA